MYRLLRGRICCKNGMSFGNFNKSEVDKFSAVGSNWWNRSSLTGTGPLHDMNPTRIDFIRKHLSAEFSTDDMFETDQIRGLKILDVGCGGGLLSESLSRLGAIVTAIDPSSENIKIAKSHSSMDPLTSTISFKEATIEDIVASGELFDAVCSLEVVEHVDNPRAFVASCVQCVRPGGSLFLSTMNRTRKAYLMTILGAEHVLGLVPVDTHDWKKFITPEELADMVERASGAGGATVGSADHGDIRGSAAAGGVCRVQTVNGLVLRPPSLLPLLTALGGGGGSACSSRGLLSSWALSESDTDVNYIIHAVKSPSI